MQGKAAALTIVPVYLYQTEFGAIKIVGGVRGDHLLSPWYAETAWFILLAALSRGILSFPRGVNRFGDQPQ